MHINKVEETELYLRHRSSDLLLCASVALQNLPSYLRDLSVRINGRCNKKIVVSPGIINPSCLIDIGVCGHSVFERGT